MDKLRLFSGEKGVRDCHNKCSFRVSFFTGRWSSFPSGNLQGERPETHILTSGIDFRTRLFSPYQMLF